MLLQLIKHHLQVRLEYRGSFVLSLVLHPLVMSLTLLMFKGIYAHHRQDTLLGHSLEQMVWYFGAGHFFYYLVWNMVDKHLSDRVLHGRLDEVLIRPYSLLTWELAQLVAQKLLSLLLELLPVFGIFAWICFPEFLTARGLGQYLLLTLLASVQFFLISFCLGAAALRWGDASATHVLKFVCVNLLAGVALPLAFFPEALQRFILALPFHYLFHTPVRYLLGLGGPQPWDAFLQTAAAQCGWIALLLLMAVVAEERSLSHFQSAGG